MKKSHILIFIATLIIINVIFLAYQYESPPALVPTETTDVFELGDETNQPWGARMFCEENPEKCGMN